MTTQEMLKLAQRIVDKSLQQIKLLIDNSDKIKELTEGMVQLDNLSDFRSAITIVYMSGLNTGILEHTSLDKIFLFLDKGFFNESILDFQVSSMNYVKNLAK